MAALAGLLTVTKADSVGSVSAGVTDEVSSVELTNTAGVNETEPVETVMLAMEEPGQNPVPVIVIDVFFPASQVAGEMPVTVGCPHTTEKTLEVLVPQTVFKV